MFLIRFWFGVGVGGFPYKGTGGRYFFGGGLFQGGARKGGMQISPSFVRRR